MRATPTTTNATRQRGMTTFELIVVISIAGILIGLFTANYRNFEQQNVLGNLAQDIALSIRLAQSYGLNVRGEVGTSDFDVSYGINFNENTPSDYFIYRTTTRGSRFQSGDTKVNEFTIGAGYTIENVCAKRGGVTSCWDGGIVVLDIVFDRPKPDAIIISDVDTGYEEATITIRDPKGFTKNIVVRVTGYVSVQ